MQARAGTRSGRAIRPSAMNSKFRNRNGGTCWDTQRASKVAHALGGPRWRMRWSRKCAQLIAYRDHGDERLTREGHLGT
eukprot:5199739-Pyramimonas_sp.AAC.2